MKNIEEINNDVENGRTHLSYAIYLSQIKEKNEPINKEIKEKMNKIKNLTNLDEKAEIYFEYAIDVSSNIDYLETLIPALYQYAKHLYKNKNEKEAKDKILLAKQKAESKNMIGEINKINNICEELNITI